MKITHVFNGFSVIPCDGGDLLALFLVLKKGIFLEGKIERSVRKDLKDVESKKVDRVTTFVKVLVEDVFIKEDPFRIRILGIIEHPERLKNKHQSIELFKGEEYKIIGQFNDSEWDILHKRKSFVEIPLIAVDYNGLIAGVITHDGFKTTFEFEPNYRKGTHTSATEAFKEVFSSLFEGKKTYIIGQKGLKDTLAKKDPRFIPITVDCSYEFAIDQFIKRFKEKIFIDFSFYRFQEIWDEVTMNYNSFLKGNEAIEWLRSYKGSSKIYVLDKFIPQLKDELLSQLKYNSRIEIIPSKSDIGRNFEIIGGVVISK